MLKPDFLYNKGMRVITYSKKRAEKKKVSWIRDGHKIAYYKNIIKKFKNCYYTLTYSLTAECIMKIIPLDDNDELYVASDYPYTYSDLINFLSNICTKNNMNRIRKGILCKTFVGNPLPILTITNFLSPENEIKTRPVVILTARVHPG